MKQVFSGKNIIVTGGASGIGAALVTQLRSEGARVAVIDRSEMKDDPNYIQADMSDIREAERAFAVITKRYGQIDYVFNSAGIFMGGEIRDTPIEDLHKVVQNNIFAVMNGAQLAYAHMLIHQSGHIINVASTAGLIPVPAMGIYGSSKYALVGFSHALRNEARALGVKVSVACPTIVDTPLYDQAIYHRVASKQLLARRASFQSAEVAAQRIIRGVHKNRATIHTSFATQLTWYLYRLAPVFYNLGARRIIRTFRAKYRTHDS